MVRRTQATEVAWVLGEMDSFCVQALSNLR